MSPGRVENAAILAFLLTTLGCAGLVVPPAEILVSPAPRRASALSRGLHYLAATQVKMATDRPTAVDEPGTWPHHIEIRLPWTRLCCAELASGIVAYQHHALTLFREENAGRLRLTDEDLREARRMRRSARELLARFRVPSNVPGVPFFGWWAPRLEPTVPPPAWLQRLAEAYAPYPRHHGILSPPGLPCFPRASRLWADADDTALAYLVALDAADVDGAPGVPDGLPAVLADWRDDSRVRRTFPAWLPERSGAFLTWVGHRRAPDMVDEVDLAVNANVLLLLGRLRALDTPGAAEATAAIVRAVREGRHAHVREISLYYPDDLMFHWLVLRAWADGPVPALAQTVGPLADDVERRARIEPDGTAHWGRRDTHLATAFAVLSLLAAGRDGPLVDGGVRHLLRTQDPIRGGWPEATCVEGATAPCPTSWRSAPFATSFALHALAAATLARARSTRRVALQQGRGEARETRSGN